MSLTSIIITVIVFAIALFALILSVFQFARKGIPLNNAFLFSEEPNKNRIYKKPLFIQSGIVFALIALVFSSVGVYVITKNGLFLKIEYLVLALTVIYAIISTIIISKKYRMI